MARIRSAEGTNLDAFSPADWARFLGLSLVWGSSFILIAFGLEALPPGPVTWLRIGLGAATLVVVVRRVDTDPSRDRDMTGESSTAFRRGVGAAGRRCTAERGAGRPARRSPPRATRVPAR